MTHDMTQFPHEGIRALVPYKPGKSIEELAREKGLKDIIKMASNENPLGCSPKALAAIRNMSPHLLATYPSAINHPLMAKLAEHAGITPNQLFLSNGSDQIFNVLLNCFALHRNKHILTHDYAFSTYAIQAKSFNIPVHTVPINPDWTVNIQEIIKACTTQTAMIFIANPNNPTGTLIRQEALWNLLTHIPGSTLLVLDEAYCDFVQKELDFNRPTWIDQFPNLIITRTFSKIYGLAGVRLGYAMSHPEISAILHRVQLPFTVNQVALNAGFAALDDQHFITQSIENTLKGKQQLSQGLSELNYSYIPSYCNFLTMYCKEDASLLYNYLLDKGIIVRPLHAYQMNEYIRVTIGTQEQNKRFLNALTNYSYSE